MKSDHDPKLRQVLESWQVSLQPAPNFKSNVWRRIAVAEKRAERTFGIRLREWFLFQLPKPAYATALLLMTALVGTTAASMQAGRVLDNYRLDQARRYLAAIDPLAIAAHMARSSR